MSSVSSELSCSASSTISLSLLPWEVRPIVARSYDVGESEKSSASSSGSTTAGDGGDGGKGTLRGSTGTKVTARGGAVNGAGSTGRSTFAGPTISSGSEVLRKCPGRAEEKLLPVSIASVGFREGGDGGDGRLTEVAGSLAASSGWCAGGEGEVGFGDFPVSLRMKDEKLEPERWGLGRTGVGESALLDGIGIG